MESGRFARRSGGALSVRLLATLLLGLACIDVSQISRSVARDAGVEVATTDAATDPGEDAADPGDMATDPVNPPTGSVLFGAPCTDSEDCFEGRCIGGVCCLEGPCPLCHVCGQGGRCVKVRAGEIEPQFRCHPPDPTTSCGRSGTCDGVGECAFYPRFMRCGDAMCDDDSVVGARFCDGHGKCVGQGKVSCAPFACHAATCRTSCSSNADCIAGIACVEGSCGKRVLGSRCSTDGDCVSGFCRQGFCCNASCDGPCTACNLAKQEGLCAAVPRGDRDPTGQCRVDPEDVCGVTGVCDGDGTCLRAAAGAVCRRACASDGSTLTTVHCDGAGMCGPATATSACPANVCDANTAACQ